MTQRQKNALIGIILGDAYLQTTGKQNARIRLEHSISQEEYLLWKMSIFPEYFQKKVEVLERFNSVWNKKYTYSRAQSTSSPEFGKMQRLFYTSLRKVIPTTFKSIFKDPLSLAIWFMDDGYYYHRDKMAYIYIPNYDETSISNLLDSLSENFNLLPSLKKKKKGLVLVFSVKETKKLMETIKKFIIPSMSSKIPLDPVSTERNLTHDVKGSSEMANVP